MNIHSSVAKGEKKRKLSFDNYYPFIRVIAINADISAEFTTINYPLPGIQSYFSPPKINCITGSEKD